jgi:hypothetical protein
MPRLTSAKLWKRELGSSGIKVLEMLEYEKGIVGKSGLRVILVSTTIHEARWRRADDRDEP